MCHFPFFNHYIILNIKANLNLLSLSSRTRARWSCTCFLIFQYSTARMDMTLCTFPDLQIPVKTTLLPAHEKSAVTSITKGQTRQFQQFYRHKSIQVLPKNRTTCFRQVTQQQEIGLSMFCNLSSALLHFMDM